MRENPTCFSLREATEEILARQTFIPSRLLEERMGETCMCTGAALLYAAHLVSGDPTDVASFFADLAAETEESFVERRALAYDLDPTKVRQVIITSKGLREIDRPAAVSNLLQEF
jgi:hypothetical protein